jgi:hypothetical protein
MCIDTCTTVIDNGYTASLCTLVISKAFDKANHYASFLKLMDRNTPLNFIEMLASWLPICCTNVKWHGLLSDSFKLDIGVRQDSVPSPLFIAVYIILYYITVSI